MLACTGLKEGKGTPLVFLHGFLGSSEDWKELIRYLPSVPCFGVDLPGHGASPFTEHFAEEMPLFSEPVHLIGYSMGGRLALQYAALFPQKVASLTLISSHPGLSSEEEKKQRIAQDENWAQQILQFEIDEFLRRWYDQSIFGDFRPDLTMRRKHTPQQLAQCLVHYSLGRQPLLPSQRADCIVGEKDAKYRALLPNATVVPRAAHMVHLENPEDLASIIQTRIGI